MTSPRATLQVQQDQVRATAANTKAVTSMDKAMRDQTAAINNLTKALIGLGEHFGDMNALMKAEMEDVATDAD